MDPAVVTRTDGGVATVTLRNPAKRNAMTPGMWKELTALLPRLAADRAVRALVLAGHGETFCAGADLEAMRDAPPPHELATAAEEQLAAFPKPTLAVVRGHCVGGGCQLAAACDLRFAATDAVFGVPVARLGLVYPAGATRRLVRLAGPATAKHLLFSGELIGAERALRTGLVDEVLSAQALAERVAGFTATLAARSQLTQAAAKEYAEGPPAGERVAYWSAQARFSGDAAEGIAAFLERREPRFGWTPGPPGQTA